MPAMSPLSSIRLRLLGAAFVAVQLAGCGGGGGGADTVAAVPAAAPAPVSVSGPAPAPAAAPAPAPAVAPAPAPAAAPGTATGIAQAPAPAPSTPSQQTLAANAVQVTVDRGVDGAALNSPYTSVTVCVPGSAVCQTIDHVLVDTGSYGLRLAANVLGPALVLPAVTTASGAPAGECAHFVEGFVWGSVRRADVKIAGEYAAGIPVQVVDDAGAPYAIVPAACNVSGSNVGNGLGANGILGIGLFVQDCPSCVSSTAPETYFACGATGCAAATMELASQVSNPVAAFAVDNNGSVLVLPSVPPGGASSLTGSLIFGIGTQANNQITSQTVYVTDSQGNFRTTYKGVTSTAFLDSGSNALFFRDLRIPQCSGFYCPASPLTLSAVTTSATGVSGTVTFTLDSITSVATNVTAATVGADGGLGRIFDWGLPFFFGRSVFTAISGARTPNGTGPYWAF